MRILAVVCKASGMAVETCTTEEIGCVSKDVAKNSGFHLKVERSYCSVCSRQWYICIITNWLWQISDFCYATSGVWQAPWLVELYQYNNAMSDLYTHFIVGSSGSIAVCLCPLTSLMMEQTAKYTRKDINTGILEETQTDPLVISDVLKGAIQLVCNISALKLSYTTHCVGTCFLLLPISNI